MTLIIATCTAKDALFTADIMMIKGGTFDMAAYAGMDDIYIGGGGPDTVTVEGETTKIFSATGAATDRLIVTGAGNVGTLRAWYESVFECGDIDRIAEVGPTDGVDTGLVAGWSDRSDGVVAYAFTEGECIPLTPGAHTMRPAPDPGSCGYDEICTLWPIAGTLAYPFEFHEAIARNVRGAYLLGRTLPGFGISAKFQSVFLDRSGVTTRWFDADGEV